jgi:hypothetical protein
MGVLARHALLALSIVMFVSRCRQEPKPEYFGTFVVIDDSVRELVRERRLPFESVPASNIVRPTTYFMTWGPFEYPRLLKTEERDGKLDVGGEEILLRVSPVEGVPELFQMKPAAALQPGTYVFVVDGCRDNTSNFRCYYPIGVE